MVNACAMHGVERHKVGSHRARNCITQGDGDLSMSALPRDGLVHCAPWEMLKERGGRCVPGAPKVGREGRGVEGCAHEDNAKLRAPREELQQQHEEEVRVQAALVDLRGKEAIPRVMFRLDSECVVTDEGDEELMSGRGGGPFATCLVDHHVTAADESRIVNEAAQKNADSAEQNPCLRACLALQADLPRIRANTAAAAFRNAKLSDKEICSMTSPLTAAWMAEESDEVKYKARDIGASSSPGARWSARRPRSSLPPPSQRRLWR